MIIRISLPFKFLIDDLNIFCEYRMETGHPLKTLTADSAEIQRSKNKRFQKLVRIVYPDEAEMEEVIKIIEEGWKQFVSLYYEGFALRFFLFFFQVRVFDSKTKHGYAENAVYYMYQKPDRKKRIAVRRLP